MHEKNPYFSLWHGEKKFRSQLIVSMPQTLHAVDALLNDNSLVGQETLPDPDTGKSDTLLYMPKAVVSKRQEAEARLDAIREELRKIDNNP